MRRYRVTLKEVISAAVYEVDAGSESEASEKAMGLREAGAEPYDMDRGFHVEASVASGLDLSDFWAKGGSGTLYHITEGTGDNLSDEDVADGYVDYIYYETYDGGGNQVDGGMWLLERPYRELSIEEILDPFDEAEMTAMGKAPEWWKEE